MSTLFNDHRFSFLRGLRPLALLIILALGVALGAGGFTAAQAQEGVKSGLASEEAGSLRREIESQYKVLPINGGVVLAPKQSRRGVQTVEVSGADIAVNGEQVNARTLRDWLGEDDAAPILRLLDLSPDQRRTLFGLAAEARRPTAPASDAPEGSDAAAAPDEPADDEVVVEIPEEPEAPEAPEAPESPDDHGSAEPSVHSGSRVRFGGSITVEKDELAEEAVAIGGSVRVDGEVSRDVVAVGGPVRINGRVGGNVTSVGSTVHLGPEAVVEGDVTSVGGTIERAKGAQIHGSGSEVGMSPFRTGPWKEDWGNWDVDHEFAPFLLFGAPLQVFGSVVWMISLMLFSCLCLLLARGPLERVERCIAAGPWKAAGVGLAGSLSLLPLLFVAAILLMITIIGCIFLLLYPVIGVVLFFVYLFGYSAVALRVGRGLETRMGRRFGSPYLSILVGVFLLQVWSVLAQILFLGPGVLDLFGLMFKLFSAFILVATMVVGFGGILLVMFGPAAWPPGPAIPIVPNVPNVPIVPAPPAAQADPLPINREERWDEPPSS